MALKNEVKILWFRGYHPLWQPRKTGGLGFKDDDDTAYTEERLAQLLDEGWEVLSAGGGGSEHPRFFVILRRDRPAPTQDATPDSASGRP